MLGLRHRLLGHTPGHTYDIITVLAVWSGFLAVQGLFYRRGEWLPGRE